MKRLHLVIIWILAFVILSLPLISGWVIKNNLTQSIEIQNQNDISKATILNYHMGWLHSTAEVKLELKDDSPASQFASIPDTVTGIFKLRITHGPVVHDPIHGGFVLGAGVIQGDIYLSDEISKLIFGKVTQERFAQLNLLSTFDNHWFLLLTIPPMNLPGPTGSTAKWDGLDIRFDLGVNGNRDQQTYSKLVFKPLLLTMSLPPEMGGLDMLRLSVGQITYENSTEAKSGMINNKALLRVPLVDYKFQGDQIVELKNFYIAQSTLMDRAKNNFNAYGTGGFDQLVANGILPYELGQTELRLSIKSMKLQELLDSVKYLKKYKRNMTNEELGNLQGMLVKIINPNTEITYDLAIKTPDGNFILNAKARWKKTMTNGSNIQGIIENADITCAIRAAIPAIDKIFTNGLIGAYTQATLNPVPSTDQGEGQPVSNQQMKMTDYLLQKGYISKDNNDYVTYLEYKDGKVFANGILVQ